MSSKPDLVTLALGTSEEDDDFQNPREANYVAQNRIMFSLKDPSLRPLKPSDGSRPSKWPRKAAAAAPGKENLVSPGDMEVGSRLSSMLSKDEERMGAKRRDLCLEADAGSVGNYGISSSDSSVPYQCDTVTQFDRRSIHEKEKCLLLASDDPKVVVNGRTEGGNLKNSKGNCYSKSIESRLLESKVNPVSSSDEGVCLRGEDCEDFEAGTQLNELMNLCCKMGYGDSSDGGALVVNDVRGATADLQRVGSVECPLCGIDITDLSDELRQFHTNDCLDKVADPTPEMKTNSPEGVVDINPVVQWLEFLGLSKYKENFLKEEIDWETLQSLTEEDLQKIGIDALGPRKKLVHAINELHKMNHLVQDRDKDTYSAAINETRKLHVPGNKLITEYFQGSSVGKQRDSRPNKPLTGKTIKDTASRRISTGNSIRKGKFRDTPPWCYVPGTPFRLDAFRYLRGDCSHWFLTHFHMDHYQGLTRNFCHGKIYCSSITAKLVNMKIGVPWEKLQILPLNKKITVAGVGLTCFDANHCPGAIIILFEPPNGKAVLHTGDFRFSGEMANNAVLQSCHIHTLILDTTYCNPKYDFPKQGAVIQFVTEAIQAEAFNPRTLFLIGSYTIGKERLYLEIARLLRKKVYVGAAKLQLLRHLELPEEDMQWFTANEMESHIHVVPMWTIASFKRIKYVANQYSARFDLIVAISPTGWTHGKGKTKTPGRRWQQGTIIRYEVPYSEHCSFTELKEFVHFISPEHIIPSVNNDGPESANAMVALLNSES
ncbi:hypothetical protein Cni_G02797 [Canna indica]|uniref:SAM domain-containing protein n=1 Tax=Canna indica TaxID=4628 RepID=A0AAQ3Q0D5_9LILI|nr:hypothetical protein Cni_G02797 [Canna indica]